MKLLLQVAQTRQQRTIKPIDDGKNTISRFYPLSKITYYAHCEALAAQHDDVSYRSTLSGTVSTSGTPRYRHKTGVNCACQAKSVACETYEADFRRLISLLDIHPDKLPLMTELAIQADRTLKNGDIDPEKEKQEAIALCKRRINAAVVLFGEGRLDELEYKRRIEQNEREMAHWEARTTETEKAALELAMCMDAIHKIEQLWEMSSPEDKQGMARNLFSYLVYDLDTQRIVDFRLKSWADRFLCCGLRSMMTELKTLPTFKARRVQCS